MRVKRGFKARRRRNRILKHAKGFRGRRKNTFRRAVEAVRRAWSQSTRDRKARKRDFRRLWIVRIDAAARQHGMYYSLLLAGRHTAGCRLVRTVRVVV